MTHKYGCRKKKENKEMKGSKAGWKLKEKEIQNLNLKLNGHLEGEHGRKRHEVETEMADPILPVGNERSANDGSLKWPFRWAKSFEETVQNE